MLVVAAALRRWRTRRGLSDFGAVTFLQLLLAHAQSSSELRLDVVELRNL